MCVMCLPVFVSRVSFLPGIREVCTAHIAAAARTYPIPAGDRRGALLMLGSGSGLDGSPIGSFSLKRLVRFDINVDNP
jgi:hypothetical protein